MYIKFMHYNTKVEIKCLVLRFTNFKRCHVRKNICNLIQNVKLEKVFDLRLFQY